jgi:DNA-binding protein
MVDTKKLLRKEFLPQVKIKQETLHKKSRTQNITKICTKMFVLQKNFVTDKIKHEINIIFSENSFMFSEI